ERKSAFQAWLLPGSPLIVASERIINFKTIAYEPSWLYEGSFQFTKSYFGPRPGELAERTQEGTITEEFKCAQFIDSTPEVRYWFRNLARKRDAFRLQTSRDWFYPDFVCQLADERILVVEYKGSFLYGSADSEEKRAIGAVWSSRSNGSCIFVMPDGDDFGA